jgi:hypothetical protein
VGTYWRTLRLLERLGEIGGLWGDLEKLEDFGELGLKMVLIVKVRIFHIVNFGLFKKFCDLEFIVPHSQLYISL